MELKEYTKYNITHETGYICTGCYYVGIAHHFNCQLCHHDRNPHNFMLPNFKNGIPDFSNPSCQCFFGITCIKKIKIEECIKK